MCSDSSLSCILIRPVSFACVVICRRVWLIQTCCMSGRAWEPFRTPSNRWGTHRVPARTRWVPLYLPPLKAFWAARFISNRLAFYIFIAVDLYINQKRFIYKMKTIYIQIENALYINRDSTFGKANCDLKVPAFRSPLLQDPLLRRCLFGMIPNSSSLLKTFFAPVFSSENDPAKDSRRRSDI